MYFYLNGNIVEESDAKISVMDHGFMYGLGVFETFRIYEGHPFLLDDHFQRLHSSLDQLNIKWPFVKKEITEILHNLLEKNNLKNAYVRWNVSAGPGILGLSTDAYTDPTTIVYIKELPQQLANTKNAKLLQIKRNSPEGTERLKSHHYLNNILGKRELGQADYEGIFLTDAGFLAEGIVSNLFWVKDKKVYTPSVDTGILNGITRRYVLALLQKKGIPLEIGFYKPSELLSADEIFITNSIQEIVSVQQVDGFYQTNQIGPITELLQKLYKRHCQELWSIEQIE